MLVAQAETERLMLLMANPAPGGRSLPIPT